MVAFNHQGEIIAINQRARSIICEQAVLENEIDSLTRKVSTQNSRTVTEINSNTRNLLVCATPLMLDGEGGAVLILNDITELRLLQEKQRLFVTNVSHELKTPLTTIMGYIDLLKTKGTDREVFNTSVHYLEGASERLLRLVDDLIDLSCLSKFEFEIEPRSTDLSGLIKDIVGQMSLKAQKFNIQIHT
ncbi:MAG: cell wall metabolism sensor histidine kinase WalK, partial [Caloramator sp.]|nr:cell wall metabolism sensor histidine kinase WalK [Caloramator sp.]